MFSPNDMAANTVKRLREKLSSHTGNQLYISEETLGGKHLIKCITTESMPGNWDSTERPRQTDREMAVGQVRQTDRWKERDLWQRHFKARSE